MKLLKHEKSNEKIDIRYLNHYLPTRLEQDDFSKKIIGLKNREIDCIDYFFQILKNKVAKKPNVTICVVPSSKVEKRASGIRDLAMKIKNYCNLTLGLQILHRRTNITPQHKRIGRASYDEQYNSQYCLSGCDNIIRKKNIILFDDVITSGNTILASSNLLLEHGAKKITCLVLGSTIALVKF